MSILNRLVFVILPFSHIQLVAQIDDMIFFHTFIQRNKPLIHIMR